MSSVKNNVGRGINIALVNGKVLSCTLKSNNIKVLFNVAVIQHTTVKQYFTDLHVINYVFPTAGRSGEVIKTEFFDMWAGGEWTSRLFLFQTFKACVNRVYPCLLQMWLP